MLNKDRIKITKKSYRLKNKEVLKIKSKEKYIKNKHIISIKTKQKRIENPGFDRINKAKYREKNKELISQKASVNYQNNKKKIDTENKKWIKNNPEKNKKRMRNWSNKKYKEDINFKLKRILRSRMRSAIRGSKSAVRYLGCSIEEFKIYIESKFESWMSWNNWGKVDPNNRTWNIDHIKPLSSFDLSNEQEFLKACHYNNLQPLCAMENIKKSDNYSE